MRDGLDRPELPCATVSGGEVLRDLGDSDLSSEDEGVEVAVHGELALVNGVVVVADNLVPDGVGGVDEVNVNDVQDLVEGLTASKRVEAVVGVNGRGEAVLALEDSELSLDGVDSLEEGHVGEHLVLSGQLSEESEQVQDSLLVEGEDVGSLVIEALADEDLLDDVSGSPLDSGGVAVQVLVDSGSGDSDVLLSVESSDSGDDSVLSEVQDVDLVVGLSEESLELLDSVGIGLTGDGGGNLDGGNLSVDVSQSVDSRGDGASSGDSDGGNSVDVARDVVLEGGEGRDDLRRATADLAVEGVVASLSASN